MPTEPNSYSVICAAAGTDLSTCVGLIRSHLELEDIAPDGGDSSILDAGESLGSYRRLMTRTRVEIFDSWNTAVKDSVSQLSSSARFRAVACHLTLYDARSQVFYSPANPTSFTSQAESRPDKVVLLIDDIYDMLVRLSGSGDILDRVSIREDTLERLREAAARSGLPGEEQQAYIWGQSAIQTQGLARDQVLADLDSETVSLHRLLAWRRSEMIAAETLAYQLGVPLRLVGIKHPLEVLPLLMRSAPVAYISHPISRHRRDRNVSGEWTADVSSLNSIPKELAARGVVGIMPTAIDELRFTSPKTVDIFDRPGLLAPRWPAMLSDFGLIGYPTSGVRFSDLLSSAEVLEVDSARASTYVRGLEAAIYNEIPFRDHYLVNHCENLLVFRPREYGSPFSGGVYAEILFFEQLASVERRRMAVIHELSDIEAIISRIESDSSEVQPMVISGATDYVYKIMADRLHTVETEHSARSIAFHGTVPPSQLSQRVFTRNAGGEVQREAWLAATLAMLHSEITGLQHAHSWCRVIAGDTTGTSVIHQAAQWLRGSGSDGIVQLHSIVSSLSGGAERLDSLAGTIARRSGVSFATSTD